jgi:hypothetical protein
LVPMHIIFTLDVKVIWNDLAGYFFYWRKNLVNNLAGKLC